MGRGGGEWWRMSTRPCAMTRTVARLVFFAGVYVFHMQSALCCGPLLPAPPLGCSISHQHC